MPEIDLLEKRLPYIRMVNAKFQSEIAAESHVCEKTIRNLEKAKANPTLKTLNCIASNFHMSVSAFLKLGLSSALMTACPQNMKEVPRRSLSLKSLLSPAGSLFFCLSPEKRSRTFPTIPVLASIQLTA